MSDPVTGNVPDELTEIGAQAVERLLQAFPIGKDSGYLGWGATSEDLARAALAVVLPVVRQQIAAEITSSDATAAVADVFVDAVPFADWTEVTRYAQEAATRIAVRVVRGEP